MHLVQDDDVVHTFTPDRSDQPFGKAILPRRGISISFGPKDNLGQRGDHVRPGAGVCIENLNTGAVVMKSAQDGA